MVDSWSIFPGRDRGLPAFSPLEAGFSIHSCWRGQPWRVIHQQGFVRATAASKFRRLRPAGPWLSRDPCTIRFASHDCLARRRGAPGGSRCWPRMERSRDRSAISGSGRENILPGEPALARAAKKSCPASQFWLGTRKNPARRASSGSNPSSRCPDEPVLARQALAGSR